MAIRITKAVPALVIEGEKQAATALAISIKNKGKVKIAQLRGSVKDILDEHKGTISQGQTESQDMLILFNIAKRYGHELAAVKAALEIQKLSEEIGLGINSGEIVAKEDGSTVLYTSLIDTVSIAKRLANSSNGEVLISKSVYDAVAANVKAKKSEKGNWIVTDLNIKERYGPQIDAILKRIKEEAKSEKKEK